MKSLRPLLLSAGLAVAALVSCDGRPEATRQAVSATADAVNAEFVALRQADETLVADVAALYGKIDTLDLSTKGMDVSEGGIYASFRGNQYYYKTVPQAACLYCSPGRPVDEAIKKQAKFLEYVQPFLQKAQQVSPLALTAFYGVQEPVTLALIAPWRDVVSVLPPGLTLSMFEWCNRGLKSPGPAVWSAQPFADLSAGWVMDVSAPVRVGGEVKGVTVISADLAKVAGRFIKPQKEALVLMGPDTTVVGISPAAEAVLRVPALEAMDYLKQIKENTFAPGKYRIADPSQNQDLQILGQNLIQGKDGFEAQIGGQRFLVVQKVLPENRMVVVGLTPR